MSNPDAASAALIAKLQAQDAYNDASAYPGSSEEEDAASDYEERAAKRQKGPAKGKTGSAGLCSGQEGFSLTRGSRTQAEPRSLQPRGLQPSRARGWLMQR